MIFARRLRQWAANPQRHRVTEARINAFSGDWREGPFHRQIATAIAAVDKPTAENVAEAVAALFDDGDWIGELIDALANAMRSDPFFVPPFPDINSDVHQGLVFYEDGRVSIAAGISHVARLAAQKDGRRGPTSIGFTGQGGIVKVVWAGAARLSFWQAPRITSAFSASTAGQCDRVGERHIADGECLIIDG